MSCVLHACIAWTVTALGHNPGDVLCWVLDVTGLAVNTILIIDLQTRVTAIIILHDLVDPSRTIALFGRIIEAEIGLDRHRLIFQRQMTGLILVVIGVGDID